MESVRRSVLQDLRRSTRRLGASNFESISPLATAHHKHDETFISQNHDCSYVAAQVITSNTDGFCEIILEVICSDDAHDKRCPTFTFPFAWSTSISRTVDIGSAKNPFELAQRPLHSSNITVVQIVGSHLFGRRFKKIKRCFVDVFHNLFVCVQNFEVYESTWMKCSSNKMEPQPT